MVKSGYKPPKNVHHAKTLYGVPIEKIYGWWNGLPYSAKLKLEKDLKRLGMNRKDDYYFATYYFGNLMGATKRAIARLYKEYGGDK